MGVRCWGQGNNYVLGTGNTGDVLSPLSADVATGVLQIATGGDFVCMLRAATAGVACWGSGAYYQLGVSSTATVQTPPATDVLTGVSTIVAGDQFACAIMSTTGGVRCWGRSS